MSNYASILTGQALTVYVNGKARVMHRDNKSFAKVLDAYKSKDMERVIKLMDIADTVNKFGNGRIVLEGGIVKYDGTPVHNAIAEKIVSMSEEEFDVNPMLNFLENLMQNPSHRAVKELYLFLEHAQLPITEDGHFLAYKRVRDDFFDIHSGTFDNSPGNVVKMERNQVNDNRDHTCSEGLHFCSIDYLPHFGSGPGNRVVIVKINPANVVSIPSDYNNTKGRCCEYLVLEEYTGPLNDNVFNKSVWLNTDTFDHSQERAEESFENEGGSSWDHDDEEEETVLDGGQLILRDEAGNPTATLDTNNFVRKPIKVAKKPAKPVYAHLIGELREDEDGVQYKITGTDRERGKGGSFTGKVLVHFDIISPHTKIAFSSGTAPYEEVAKHKVVEHIIHEGAHMKPDMPETVHGKASTTVTHVATHIPATELAQASLAEDKKKFDNQEQEDESSSFSEDSEY